MRKCDVVFSENYSYSLEDAYAKIFECVDENGILCIQDFPDYECEIEGYISCRLKFDEKSKLNALKELNKELEVQWKRLNSQNQREKEETNFDLYKYDDTISKHNRNIQKIFYKFVLKIFKKYYYFYCIYINKAVVC